MSVGRVIYAFVRRSARLQLNYPFICNSFFCVLSVDITKESRNDGREARQSLIIASDGVAQPAFKVRTPEAAPHMLAARVH